MSDNETDYEIVYTLRRRLPGDEDFSEIGFGTSGMWSTPGECAHMLSSDVQNYAWEVEAGMPDPDGIKVEVEADDDR